MVAQARRSMRRLMMTLLLGLATALLAMASPAGALPVHAHAAHPEDIELFAGVEGPYAMRVVAVPYVGYLHVTVILDPVVAGALPRPLDIKIAAAPDGSPEPTLGPAPARREAFDLENEYSVTLDAEAEGDWTVFVDIASDAGHASLALPITLRQPGGIPISAVLTGLGLLLPILWLLWGSVRDRRAKAGKGRAKRGRRH